VIPGTLLGLLVFAASIGPGYVYVRVAERHRPRSERTALLETAELVSVGGFASALAFLLGLVIAKATGWIDLNSLANRGTEYVITHPARGLTFLLAVLLTSYGGTWLVAKRVYKKFPAAVTHYPIWFAVLGDEMATRYVFATVELRDGRGVYGVVQHFSLEEAAPENREIVLEPLSARRSGSHPWTPLDDESLILRASDIVAISVKYAPVPDSERRRWIRATAS
jgi:Family of unknown function (DUF6338)